MTTYTYNDKGPLVRGVEGDLKYFGVLLLMLIEIPQVSASKTNKARLRGIAEN